MFPTHHIAFLRRTILAATCLTVMTGCESAVQPPGDTSSADRKKSALPVADPVGSRVREEAKVGVGKKGHYGGGGPVSTPASAYFRTQERLAFQSVGRALQLYKLTNGAAPKSHDEFMKEIIEFNRIKLPELPDGTAYVYDPETEKLMVERSE